MEQASIEQNGTLWLSYKDVPHELCQNGQWEHVKSLLIQRGAKPSTATSHTNQIRAFYEADENTLWVTFYKNRLWYCFAEPGVTRLPDGSKTRDTKDGWKSTDVKGKSLEIGGLSGSLLSMQGYRGTVCTVREFKYLIRKINGETVPAEQTALDARTTLIQALEQIIKQLHWKDFELLTDLIFRQAGWQRVSQLGKTQKTLDLDLLSPIADERYLVQVKSSAGRQQFEQFQVNTSNMAEYRRYYFVVHTPVSGLTEASETETHKLWLPADIAKLVTQYGLIDWVIEKAT
ncbi:MAG: hypothetical protein L0332_17035 [Chloroflexi bacterium]|nr:hypothetical protein [Chloroflexota bacterium]